MLVFGERETRVPREKPLGAKYQQTQPTYDAESGNRTRATFLEGERSLDHAITLDCFKCFRDFLFVISMVIQIFENTSCCANFIFRSM